MEKQLNQQLLNKSKQDQDTQSQIDHGDNISGQSGPIEEPEIKLQKVVSFPPEPKKLRAYDIEAFKNVQKSIVGQNIEFSNLHEVDNQMTEQVENAVNDLKVKMIEAAQKTQYVDKPKHDCKKERLAYKLFTDQRSSRLLSDYSGRVEELFETKMEEVLKSQIQNKQKSVIDKQGDAYSMKVVRWEDQHFYILTEFIYSNEEQKEGKILLQILKFQDDETIPELLHSTVLNESQDAFCTPPESLSIQQGQFLYYFKIEKNDHECNGETLHAHLKKFDLQTMTEDDESIDTYTLQNTEIDHPLYIQFANDGYEFDSLNKHFFDEELDLDSLFVAIQYKINVQRSVFSIRCLKDFETELKVVKSDCFTHIHFFVMSKDQAQRLGLEFKTDVLVGRHILYTQPSIFEIYKNGQSFVLKDLDTSQPENKKNEETLEQILYKDTFFDSQIRTFDMESGEPYSTKEINSFMAKAIQKIIKSDKNANYSDKNARLDVVIDFNLQKFIFIYCESDKEGTEKFIIQQYDLDQTDLVKFDQGEEEDVQNPVIEFMEESGPINISKKYPNIARTMDGICAFSADDTISFRFKDNYDFIPSCSIISKRDDNTDIQSLRELLLGQNSLATIFIRNLKIFKLIHIPSGDMYTLIANKKFKLNKQVDENNMPIVVRQNPQSSLKQNHIQIKFQEYIIAEDDMPQIPLVAGNSQTNCLYFIVLDLNKREIQTTNIVPIPDDFEYSFDYEGLFINQSSDLYTCSHMKKTGQKSFCKNYQVVIQNEKLRSQLVYEYRVYWTERGLDSSQYFNYSVDVSLISQKQIYLSAKDFKTFIRVVPKFDSNYNVTGTQVIEFKHQVDTDDDDELQVVGEYEIANLQEHEYPIQNHILKSVYFKFQNRDDGALSGIMVDSRINEEYLEDNSFTEYEQFVMLYNSNITLLNMIPKDFKNLSKIKSKNCVGDLFKKMEILEGHSISDFSMDDPETLESMFNECKEGQSGLVFESLLDQVIKNDPAGDENRRQYLMNQKILRETDELSFDFCFKSMLDRCMQGGDRYNQTAELIFKQLLSQRSSRHNQRLMMNVMAAVLTKQTRMRHYFEFFKTHYQPQNPNEEDQSKLQLKSFMPQDHGLPQFSTHTLQVQKLKFNNQNFFSYIEDLCSEQIWKANNQKDATIPVDHSYVDFWSLILNQKIQAAYAKKSGIIQDDIRVEMNNYIVSYFMEKIVSKCGTEVKDYRVVQSIIDYQYFETQVHFVRQLFGFFVFFFLPFLLQIFTERLFVELVCLCTCLAVSLILFSEEIIKMKYTGIYYFFNVWSLNNIMMFILFVIYFFVKISAVYNSSSEESISSQTSISTSSTTVINNNGQTSSSSSSNVFNDNYESQESQHVTNAVDEPLADNTIIQVIAILNFVIIMQAFTKMVFYLRVNEKFGNLLNILIATVNDIKYFLFLILSWLCIASLQFFILGVPLNQEYDESWTGFAYFLQTMRSFIGNVQPPDESLLITDSESNTLSRSFLISAIWIVWFLNLVLGQIILIYFMIAIIFQSYEHFMSQQEEQKYLFRALMNKERLLYQKECGALEMFDCLVFSEEKSSDSHEWKGFVHTIKQYVHSENNALHDKISQNRQEIKEMRSEVNQRIGGLENKIEKLYQHLIMAEYSTME